MKKCPKCSRTYSDETLNFCLDDGEWLVGPHVTSEPQTAVLDTSEALTRTFEPHDRTMNAARDEESIQVPTGKRWLAPGALVVLVLVLLGAGVYWYYGRERTIDSMVVLPFQYSEGDQDAIFLSEGIPETIINNFTQIPELRVIARTTAFRYRGREGEPKVIGQELNVGSILTGRISRQGQNLIVQVDLINTSTGEQIWGNRYQGTMADLVSIQSRIAQDVSEHLKYKKTAAQQQQIAKTYTTNPDAYQHYMRGQYFWNRRTAENLDKAIAEFQKAVSVDPKYALGYVGLANCYIIYQEYTGRPSKDKEAKEAADQAYAIDPSLSEIQAIYGLYHVTRREWDMAEASFKKAIAMNPNYPTAYHWYYVYHQYTEREREGRPVILRAEELDPLSLIIKYNVAQNYRNLGDHDAALKTCDKIAEIDPLWALIGWCYGEIYLVTGKFDQAVPYFQRMYEQNKTSSNTATLGFILAKAGKRSEANEKLAEVKSMYDRGRATGFDLAMIYVGLGDHDEAFRQLDKETEQGSPMAFRVIDFVQFNEIRNDPRYDLLLKKNGLRGGLKSN